MTEVIAAATVLAVVIGWIVAGTQRVNEQLLVERRMAYHELLDLARGRQLEDSAEKSRRETPQGKASHRAVLEKALTTAELVASPDLYECGALRLLHDVGLETGVPEPMREAFLELVREESIRNSVVFRWRHFRQYRKTHDIATLTSRPAPPGPDAT